MSNSNSSKQVLLSVIGIAVLVIAVVGVAFAFFNYTRTGSSNVIKTGRIYFNAEQDGGVTLSDLFPITIGENDEITPQTPGVGSLSIHVTGDTNYEEGIEYLIKAVNVTGTNGTNLPISIAIDYEPAEGNNKTIGTSSEDYFNDRGGNTSYYKVLSNDSISEGEELVVGYIAPGQTGIDGYLTIMAYLDAENIAITDTYPEGTVHTVKTTGYSSNTCETTLTGAGVTAENAATYCATASDLQDTIDAGNVLSAAQVTALVTAGIVEEYTDGTTSNWVGDRTVLTTEEWNSLQSSGVSFQIKAEANEGIWVDAPIPTISSCPGCKFMYTTSHYTYGGGVNATNVADLPTGLVKEDYNDVIASSNKNYFLGFTESNGKIDRAFACGIKGTDNNGNVNEGKAFCIEGSTDGSTFNDNVALITGSTLWNDVDGQAGRCYISSSYVSCLGSVDADANSPGGASTYDDYAGCGAYKDSTLSCHDY